MPDSLLRSLLPVVAVAVVAAVSGEIYDFMAFPVEEVNFFLGLCCAVCVNNSYGKQTLKS